MSSHVSFAVSPSTSRRHGAVAASDGAALSVERAMASLRASSSISALLATPTRIDTAAAAAAATTTQTSAPDTSSRARGAVDSGLARSRQTRSPEQQRTPRGVSSRLRRSSISPTPPPPALRTRDSGQATAAYAQVASLLTDSHDAPNVRSPSSVASTNLPETTATGDSSARLGRRGKTIAHADSMPLPSTQPTVSQPTTARSARGRREAVPSTTSSNDHSASTATPSSSLPAPSPADIIARYSGGGTPFPPRRSMPEMHRRRHSSLGAAETALLSHSRHSSGSVASLDEHTSGAVSPRPAIAAASTSRPVQIHVAPASSSTTPSAHSTNGDGSTLSSPRNGKPLINSPSSVSTRLTLTSPRSSMTASNSTASLQSGTVAASTTAASVVEFDASVAYAAACARHSLAPNSVLLRMFAHGLAERRVWDCGYLYLGHRGVVPLLEVLSHPACASRVEELSLRGTGLRNSELVRLIAIVRARMASTLRTIDLGENEVSESGGAQLLLLVHLAPCLTRLHVDGTRIDQVTVRAINSACQTKLAARPTPTKLASTSARYSRQASSGAADEESAVDAWKKKLLATFERKENAHAGLDGSDLSSSDALAGGSDDAAARERARQTIRLLLRCLQTDGDIVGLLLRFDESKHPEVWRDVRVVRRFVKRLIETGHHRKAFELADRFVTPRVASSSNGGESAADASSPPPNFANDQVLQWWRIYALARSRNFTDAFKEINLLLPTNLAPTIHANLLGLAGLLRKCLYESGARADLASAESKLQEEDANESASLYLASYETAHGLMEGIAAATMLRLGGKDDQSTRLAKKLLKEATAELALLHHSRAPEDVERKLNLFSALAEANIHLQRPNAAYRHYQQAVEVAGSNVNHLAQLQQNLQLLSAARVRIGDVMQLFHAGNVCVFVGLAVDHPTHDAYAFPPERDVELELSYQIDRHLDQHQIQIGFVSLACGSEILFAEKMLEKKCELHVVLPFHLDDFFTASIDYGLNTMYRWHARAQAILKRCEVHYVTNERFLGDHGLFHFQAVIMEGLALIRARELGVGTPIALAVLDSAPPFANCRPNAFIRSWKSKKATTAAIDLQDVRRRVLHLPVPTTMPKTSVQRFSEAGQQTQTNDANSSEEASSSNLSGEDTAGGMFTAKPSASLVEGVARHRHDSLQSGSSSGVDSTGSTVATIHNATSATGKFLTAMQFASKITRVVKYMMFADIESLQPVSEELTPLFFKTFFKLLEKTRKESRVSPFYANTWGSGLYFIFHTVDQCAEFSLHLLRVVDKMDWTSLGLPPATACLGMHGGPLFPGYNPVEEKDLYFGAHVCRAARIKAVTPAGHAYASEQFVAALAVADGHKKKFFFEYLGHRDLAKSYDRCPLYRLCRIEDVRKHALINRTSPSGDAAGAAGGDPAATPSQTADVSSSSGAATDLSSPSGDPFASPKTQSRRIKERRLRDRNSRDGPFSPTPFSAHDAGVLGSGPLTANTIHRATPNLITKLVEHYLSLDTTADGLMQWQDVTLLHALVSRLIALGQTHVAFLVVQKALGYDSAFKHDLRLKYYRVLALRHTQKADEFMAELKQAIQSHSSPSQIPVDLRAAVLSLSGRMLKDQYSESLRNGTPESKLAHESAREYFFSYELKHASFPAINAATMLLLSNQKERARALAKFSVRLVADELLARSQQSWNPSSDAGRLMAAVRAREGLGLDQEKVLGDGTVLDELTVREERERAVRGETAGKTSEKAPGEGAKGGPVGEEYWMYAAMGEAYLVLEESDKSLSWYRHALEKATGHMGSISAMFRNLKLLQTCMTVPKELSDLFIASIGRVLVCAAHPIAPWTGHYKPEDVPVRDSDAKTNHDHPSSSTASSAVSRPPPLSTLSPSLRLYRLVEQRILIEIRKHIDAARPTVAFVLLITDTDLLFAECMMERGVEVHVLLVFTKPVFLEHCVEKGFDRLHQWRSRIDLVFKRCVLHFVTRDKQKSARQLLYHFNRRVLQGLAITRAQQIDCGHPLAMCVLDGLDRDGHPMGEDASGPLDSPPSGTRSFPPLDRSSAGVEFPLQWCALDPEYTCTIINLNAVRQICAQQSDEMQTHQVAAETDAAIAVTAARAETTTATPILNDTRGGVAAALPPLSLTTPASPTLGLRRRASKAPSLPMVPSDAVAEQSAEFQSSEACLDQSAHVATVQSSVIGSAPLLRIDPNLPTVVLQHTTRTRRHPYADHRGLTLPAIPQSPHIPAQIERAHDLRRRARGRDGDSNDEDDGVTSPKLDFSSRLKERVAPGVSSLSRESSTSVPHPVARASTGLIILARELSSDDENDEDDVSSIGSEEEAELVRREQHVHAHDENAAINAAWERAAASALAREIQIDGTINTAALVANIAATSKAATQATSSASVSWSPSPSSSQSHSAASSSRASLTDDRWRQKPQEPTLTRDIADDTRSVHSSTTSIAPSTHSTPPLSELGTPYASDSLEVSPPPLAHFPSSSPPSQLVIPASVAIPTTPSIEKMHHQSLNATPETGPLYGVLSLAAGIQTESPEIGSGVWMHVGRAPSGLALGAPAIPLTAEMRASSELLPSQSRQMRHFVTSTIPRGGPTPPVASVGGPSVRIDASIISSPMRTSHVYSHAARRSRDDSATGEIGTVRPPHRMSPPLLHLQSAPVHSTRVTNGLAPVPPLAPSPVRASGRGAFPFLGVSTLSPLPPSTGHRGHKSRQPSVSDLAELILPPHQVSTTPLPSPVAPATPALVSPRFVDSGLGGLVRARSGSDAYIDQEQNDVSDAEADAETDRRLKEQADAIAKAVDATYPQEEREPARSRARRPATSLAERPPQPRAESISRPPRATITHLKSIAHADSEDAASITRATSREVTPRSSSSTRFNFQVATTSTPTEPPPPHRTHRHHRTSSTPLQISPRAIHANAATGTTSVASTTPLPSLPVSPSAGADASPAYEQLPTSTPVPQLVERAGSSLRTSAGSRLSSAMPSRHRSVSRGSGGASITIPRSPSRLPSSQTAARLAAAAAKPTSSPSTSPPSFIGPTLTEVSYSRAVRYIIFADVRNYSKLSQEETPLFNTHFLTIVRQVIDLFLGIDEQTGKSTICFFNTWGDGLFVVFSEPAQCARFALVLLQRVRMTKWEIYKLPPGLTMRVGMHAGPVLIGWDPVVRHQNYFGPHVLYAQLIEPITTPGCAFATAQFAACLATSPDSREFKLEYIGSAVLEKEFADEEYAKLSTKERQDYARCHLFHLQENKQWSARRGPPAEGTTTNADTHSDTTTGGDETMGDFGVAMAASPSLTYSLLRTSQLKPDRENPSDARDLPHLPGASAAAPPVVPSAVPFDPDLTIHPRLTVAARPTPQQAQRDMLRHSDQLSDK